MVHHRVDGVFQLENFSLHIYRDLSRQIATGNSCRDLGNISDLRCQISGHGIDGVGQILPGTGNARNHRLSAEFAVGANFASHARHFRSERAQLIHHRVDGFFELLNLAMHVNSNFPGEIAAGHSSCDLSDVSYLAG